VSRQRGVSLDFPDKFNDSKGPFFRSFSTHQARSSKAAGSNSKICTGFVKRNTLSSFPGFQQPLFHLVLIMHTKGIVGKLEMASGQADNFHPVIKVLAGSRGW
jgi:hypothetical protein